MVSFTELPGEIRNMIYDQLILDIPRKPIGSHNFDKGNIPKNAFSLAQVNKQLRKEYFDMYFSGLDFETTWPSLSTPIAQNFLATGNTGAQPGTLRLHVGAGPRRDKYSKVDILSLVRLRRRVGKDNFLRHVEISASFDASVDQTLVLFCNRLRHLVYALSRSDKISFHPSKGIKSTVDNVWSLDVVMMLEESWKTLPKHEWNILIMIYSAFRRLPGATVRVEENIDGVVQRYTCQNNGSGLRIVTASEDAESAATE
ncbi:hypothetical protein PMIN03_006532 [Paraphaeosphaeria minitans]|uniref:F-box domain-containing protein n=1 Tax=Paraphaeosphaeria minitans TaxID=565426 RepID=A0A9P6KPN6_9PLEO|nr:hypothetical protein PMIN01_07160 [Paraphaeosphaeria minitans]